MEFLQLEAPLMMSYLNAHQPRHIFYGLKQSEIRFSLYRWDAKSPILSRECVSTGAAGARTRRSLGHHLLNPLILRLLVLCTPAVLRPRALQDAPAPADPNS